ncbi:Origin of replication complex subunit 6 [Coemansia sp. RSA 2336]|nr:Origin of replication complex subunit 6 [Coemansia sp. RSA 2336]
MSAILAECISKLQLDDVPRLVPKAAQFFDQIGQRLPRSKNTTLALCRPSIAVLLACESLSVPFNESAACSLSSVSLSDFQACVKEVRTLLGLVKHTTLEELDVLYGPPTQIIEYSRKLLDEFRCNLGATIPVAVSKNMNWEDSVYIASAFFLVCKHFKKRVASKSALVTAASVKPAVFNNAVGKLEQYGSAVLREIDGLNAPKTPSRKRGRDLESDTELANAPQSSTRTQPLNVSHTPITRAHIISSNVPDELGQLPNSARKRTRREAAVSHPATEPVNRTRSSRLGTPPTFNAPVKSTAEPSVRRKPGRPPKTAAQLAARSEASVNARAAKNRQRKAEAVSRLRFGIISMIQDRDYKATPQYASYQTWKTSILNAS